MIECNHQMSIDSNIYCVYFTDTRSVRVVVRFCARAPFLHVWEYDEEIQYFYHGNVMHTIPKYVYLIFQCWYSYCPVRTDSPVFVCAGEYSSNNICCFFYLRCKKKFHSIQINWLTFVFLYSEFCEARAVISIYSTYWRRNGPFVWGFFVSILLTIGKWKFQTNERASKRKCHDQNEKMLFTM